jgi:hypothetical protein
MALIAYEECAHYLELTYDQLQMIADLSDLPAPRMLLLLMRVRELIKDKTNDNSR